MQRFFFALTVVVLTVGSWSVVQFTKHIDENALKQRFELRQRKLRQHLSELSLQQIQAEGWGRDKTLDQMFPDSSQEYLKSIQTGFTGGDEASYALISTHKDLLPLEEHRKVAQFFLDMYPIVDYAAHLKYEEASILENHSRKHHYADSLEQADGKEMHTWNTAFFYQSPNSHRPNAQYDFSETEWWIPRTTQALMELHEKKLDAFVNMPEFGWFRVRNIGFDDLVRTPARKIYIRDPEVLAKKSRARSLSSFIEEMHLSSTNEFKENLGFAVEHRKARGFQKHAVNWIQPTFIEAADHESSQPQATHQADHSSEIDEYQNVWQLRRMELVSLLKHPQPLAYYSEDYLPSMAHLGHIPTRPLSAFEADAVRKLYEGETLVVSQTPRQIHFVGAIRGGQVCLNCHATKAGELLGAFTYQLRLVE